MDVTAKTAETTSGRAAFYDYAGLAAVSDEILVLVWNPHYATSMPGPVADMLRTCAGRRARGRSSSRPTRRRSSRPPS